MFRTSGAEEDWNGILSAYKSPFRPTKQDLHAINVLLLVAPPFSKPPPHTFLVPRGYLSRYDAIYDARSALVSQFEPDVITKIESRVTGRTGREGSRLEERPVKELLNPRGFVINLVGRASRNVEPTPTGFGKRWNRRKRRTRTI